MVTTSLAKIVSNRIKRWRGSRAWDIADIIIKYQDIVENHVPDFIDRYPEINPEYYVCIRDLHFSCVYLHRDYFNLFSKNTDIIDLKRHYINLTQLMKYKVKDNCYKREIFHGGSPYISIRRFADCCLGREDDKYHVYIERIIIIKKEFDLFKDLDDSNLKNISD